MGIKSVEDWGTVLIETNIKPLKTNDWVTIKIPEHPLNGVIVQIGTTRTINGETEYWYTYFGKSKTCQKQVGYFTHNQLEQVERCTNKRQINAIIQRYWGNPDNRNTSLKHFVNPSLNTPEELPAFFTDDNLNDE